MAPQQFQFIMRTGPTPGKIFELITNEIYIGREVTNDVVIDEAEVSRKHARLVMQAGGYLLEDLGSTNGTFVNGQRLMGPHVLRPGELVMLGETVGLAFEAGYDPDATMVASPSQLEPAAFQPPPKESYVPAVQPQPVPQQPPQPVYSEPVPATTAQPYSNAVEEKSNRTWLYAGCGCLVVVLCVAVAGVYLFDSLTMYCTPPFDAIGGLFNLYTCPIP